MSIKRKLLVLIAILFTPCAWSISFEVTFDNDGISESTKHELSIRKKAIREAINKWEKLPGEQTIRIFFEYDNTVTFLKAENKIMDSAVSVKKNYINDGDNTRHTVYIPLALGIQLKEEDLLGGKGFHTKIKFSDRIKYLMCDGLISSLPTDTKWQDLEAVIMHETAHCLGIISTMTNTGDWLEKPGRSALPTVWDIKLGCYMEYTSISDFLNATPTERLYASTLFNDVMTHYARFNGDWLCTYNENLGENRPGESFLYGDGYALAVHTEKTFIDYTSLIHWPEGIEIEENLMYPYLDENNIFKSGTPFIREFLALMDVGYKYLVDEKPIIATEDLIKFLKETTLLKLNKDTTIEEEEVVILNPTDDDWKIHAYEFYGDSAFYLVGGADSIPEDFPAGSLLTPKIGFSSDEPGLHTGLFRLIYSNLGRTAQHKSIEISLEGFVIGEDTDNDYIPDSFECNPATESCIDALFILGESDSSGPNLDDAGGILYEADNILDGFNDLDGDGWNNYEELLQGSDASDPGSTPVFTVEGLQSEVVTITNNIIWPIEIRKIALTGEDSVYFSLAGNEVDPFSLDPEESREVHVLYLPTTPETPREATVEIEYAFSSAVHTKYVTVKGGWE